MPLGVALGDGYWVQDKEYSGVQVQAQIQEVQARVHIKTRIQIQR